MENKIELNKIYNEDCLEGMKRIKDKSIDMIKSVLKTQFKAFCIGNALKYSIRAEKKNGLEDYKKARVYLDWIIKEMEE